jgi:hypothetical protein
VLTVVVEDDEVPSRSCAASRTSFTH